MVGCSPVTIADRIKNRKLLIFCAVKFEARALQKTLGCGENPPFQIHTIGPGAKYLPPTAPSQSIILMAGLAGGLDPALKVGDVLIDSLSDILPPELSCPVGTIRTVNAIVPTPAARAALFSQTGARAVDMENAHVRAFAHKHNASYIGIRAISDAADHTLNPAIARFLDDTGNVKPAALAKELLLRPKLALELNSIRRNSELAMSNLAKAITQLVPLLRL